MSNVKPGDLARVVAPYVSPGRGSFVTVVKAAKLGDYNACGSSWLIESASWVCEGWVRDVDGVVRGPLRIIADTCLRRIDALGQDEAIEAGKPEPVPEKASA